MTTAATQPSTRTQTGLVKGPIFVRLPVNLMSGTIANGSCRLRITWLNTRRW